MATQHNTGLTEEKMASHGDNSSGSRDHDFVDKLEHMEPGYGHHDGAGLERKYTEADDPNIHQSMNLRLFLGLLAMSFCWVGSQIPLYLFGSVLPDIYSEIGGANGRYIWLVVGYLIPVSAICPFVGALSDIFGRKAVASFGQVLLVIGPIVVCTAHHINVAIGGMVIAGLGAGLNELIALAGTSEMVPVRKRAAYVGFVVFTILPFCPSPLWAQLIAARGGWRWNGALVGIFNFVGLILVAVTYRDPVRERPPVKLVLKQIDYIGGILSTAGVTLFMMGLQWGARQYTWGSAHVLVPLIMGLILIIAFFVWEFFAPYPMCPRALFSKDKRSMILILLITFFSGGNFFVLLLFWPTQVYNMYGNDPLQIGIRTLPIGFGIIFGAAFALFLIGLTKGRTTILMIFWTLAMTGFTGAMSAARTYNLTPTVYPILTLASISVGAVIIPCSIIAQVMCPQELIGTVTAITLSIRYIGGAIGFTAYYNVFFHEYFGLANTIAAPQITAAGVTYDYYELLNLITLASNAQYEQFRTALEFSPTLRIDPEAAYNIIIAAVQDAFAIAYQWPYWISIAFGGVCIVCSFGLRDIKKHMEEFDGPA
ncbi:Trichothecene efflux pump TRI12 [Fulvia fulva]|nr:Trichothecene efflux pump TRI12 [Fulvia fulva]WPV19693.1 Trichothecene efflux pump TRI12 [Fulvia fulva]WPV34453.1 Trichothecene efflux pump TRI12 [Fulvia fulva]